MLNLHLEGDLLDRTQAADPGAATPLHDRFAAGLRVLLRHKIPNADLETGVFYVLVTVARAVREGKVQDDRQLLAQVRSAASSFVEGVTVARVSNTPGPIDQIRGVIRQLGSKEQEILIRFYHLAQTEEEISQQMKVRPEAIRKAKRTARERFLATK